MYNKIYKRKGIWYFEDYFNYISSVIESIPKNIVNFIANPQFYNFGDESLYDSLVEKFELKYSKKSHLPILSIKFKGAYGSNYIFKFEDIRSIVFPNDTEGLLNHELLIHQFHLRGKGILQYEFIFSNNAKLKILFRKLSINVETK
ncbi:MAG: hypothetical protein J1F38_05220 [Muribaculaceae bacterium]|nr:hypothetical protein [Muribaculaceae bacterium]